MDKISVIVPVYNVEQYLDRCVESIVHQTYQNLEIILVDDGSPDRCPQMCDEWAKKDERIIVIHKENGGVSSARNAGLDIATGDYVHFVDSDDWLKTNAYEILIKYINGYSLLIFNAYFVNKDKITIGYTFVEKDYFKQDRLFCDFFNFKLTASACWNKLFLLKIIRENHLQFDTGIVYGEDYYFFYNYLTHIDNAKRIESPLYYYDTSRDTSISNIKNVHYYSRYLITCKILENEKEDYERYCIVLKRLFIVISTIIYEVMSTRGHKSVLYEIRSIIKKYYNDYKKIGPVENKFKIIRISPTLYMLVYKLSHLF